MISRAKVLLRGAQGRGVVPPGRDEGHAQAFAAKTCWLLGRVFECRGADERRCDRCTPFGQLRVQFLLLLLLVGFRDHVFEQLRMLRLSCRRVLLRSTGGHFDSTRSCKRLGGDSQLACGALDLDNSALGLECQGARAALAWCSRMPLGSFLGSVSLGQPLLRQGRARLAQSQAETALDCAASEAIQLVEGHRSHRPQLLLLLHRGLLPLLDWLGSGVA